MTKQTNKKQIAGKTFVFDCNGCIFNNGQGRTGCGGSCLKEQTLPSADSPPVKLRLVIAEKPSVGRTIARLLGADNRKNGFFEGNGWLVSWCLGHLVRLPQPHELNADWKHWRVEDLPIIPDQWSYLPYEEKKSQLNLLKNLMNDSSVGSLVCATDAGREGELIFRLVYDYCECTKPVERLWLNSMEDSAILDAFQNLRPSSDFDRLYQAGLCRSRADWLIGINSTRKYSALCRRNLKIGRVQSPTLAMLVHRAEEIQNFIPQIYYNIHLISNGLDAIKDHIFDQDEADHLVEKLNGETAVVTSVERKKHTVNPPQLYDLTALQREANRYYGYSAQDTLTAAQQLYECKLLSYPRTDSRYITEDMQDSVQKLVKTACYVLNIRADFPIDTSQIADNSKVSDHYALLPTAEVTRSALAGLDEMQLQILKLVLIRLLCAVSEPHRYEEVTTTLECGGETFTGKSRTILQDGWKGLERLFRNGEKKEETFPLLETGQRLENVQAVRSDHKTTPPPVYTEDTLLAAMERAAKSDFSDGVERVGLGTPATRATIIEKILSSGYAVRRGRSLVPTELGKNLIAMLPEALVSPQMTSEWENALLLIQRGELDPETFMEDIRKLTYELVEAEDSAEKVHQIRYDGQPPAFLCPHCSEPVYENETYGFFCSECSWRLWKNNFFLVNHGIALDRALAKRLVEHGEARVRTLSGERQLALVNRPGKGPYFQFLDADPSRNDTASRKKAKANGKKTKAAARPGKDGKFGRSDDAPL